MEKTNSTRKQIPVSPTAEVFRNGPLDFKLGYMGKQNPNREVRNLSSGRRVQPNLKTLHVYNHDVLRHFKIEITSSGLPDKPFLAKASTNLITHSMVSQHEGEVVIPADGTHQEVLRYARRIISHKARQLARAPGFTRSDRQDLEQELILELLRRLPGFNPRKANPKTFVAWTLDQKTKNLLRQHTFGLRDYHREERSLNEQVISEAGVKVELSETITQEEPDRWRGRPERSPQEQWELAHDVKVMLDNLPEHLRVLCQYLKYDTVPGAARRMGVSERTIYVWLKKVRNLCRKFEFLFFFQFLYAEISNFGL
jgi:RNA polymerase sigma-70 factor (ECF subfamily)